MANWILSAGLLAFIVFIFAIALNPQKIEGEPEPDQAAFSPEWKELIFERIPLTRKLPKPLLARLYRHIAVFLRDKKFIGERGVEVTEEMRVVTAAQACILVLGRDDEIYPLLDTIHMFSEQFLPHHFTKRGALPGLDHGHVIGLSWQDGPMALAWNHAIQDAVRARDGHNVVFHEFAHQLDREAGLIDGVPIMEDFKAFSKWMEVMRREFAALQEAQRLGKNSVINFYGATGIEEFFAVVTEVFFENPQALKSGHKELYGQFSRFYNLDPEKWRLQKRPRR